MRLSTKFLRASVVALAFCACGRSDARFLAGRLDALAPAKTSASSFEPKAGRDVLMTVGVTLDKQSLARIANTIIDRIDETMKKNPVNGTNANENAKVARTAKLFITAFLDDPFMDAPADVREFVDAVGLRNAKSDWAVLSVGDIEFQFTNGTPEPKYVPEMSVAVASDIDMEKVAAYARQKFAEDKSNDTAIAEVQVAGEKAWQIVPTTEEAKQDLAKLNLDPCFASLDGKLVLLATTKAVLEKQILLYRKGQGEGKLLCDFKPGTGDIACFAMKDIGALAKKCVKDPERDLKQLKAFIPNGDKMVFGLGDTIVRLSEKPNGNISFSMKLFAATAEDADAIRSMLKMCVLMGTAHLGQNPAVRRGLVESIQRWKIEGTGNVIDVSHDDVITMATEFVAMAIQDKSAKKAKKAAHKSPPQRASGTLYK